MGTGPKSVDQLDDPEDHLAEESEPPSKRPTLPPRPTYPMLRDSCQSMLVGEGPSLDETGEAKALDVIEIDVEVELPASTDVVIDGDSVPAVILSASELEWVSLDHESLSLLSAMNGIASLRAITSVCGIDLGRGQLLVERMVRKGIVRMRGVAA